MLGLVSGSQAFVGFDSLQESEQVEVEGLWQEPKRPKPSQADKTRKRVEALKQKINDNVDNTVENMRLKNEKRMGHRLESMFQGKGLGGGAVEDSVALSQAAPAQITVERSFGPRTKTSTLALVGGFTNFQVDKKGNSHTRLADNDYSSHAAFAVEFSRHLINAEVGLGFGHASLKFDDNPYSFDRGYYAGPGYGYQEREISGKIMSFYLSGKFYLSEGAVRPFISAEVGFSRLNLDFDGSNNLSDGSFQPYGGYGDETHAASYVNAGAGMGMAIALTDNFGLVVQGKAAKNFAGDDSKRQDFRQYYSGHHYINDQEVLRSLGDQIANATRLEVTVGATVAF